MPGDRFNHLRARHIRPENGGDGENGLRQFGPVGILVANRDDSLRIWVRWRPARAEATRAAQTIGDPARNREDEQARGPARRETLAQRIDETLDDLLRAIRADLMASMADGGVADARHGL